MHAVSSPALRASVLVALYGVLWARTLGITQYLDPTNVDWMLQYDWVAHLFGWLFTRYEPWSLPLGAAPGLLFPTGTSAALTDAIPVLSLVGKALSPLFGDRLQLFGLWMLTGVLGTGVTGVLLCRPWLRDTASLFFAGCVFLMSPIVATRVGHPAFLFYWVLLALAGLAFWPVAGRRSARRVAAVALALDLLACGTHAYLAVMASALTGAVLLRLAVVRRDFGAAEGLAWLFAGPATSLSALWLFGYLSGLSGAGAGAGAEGFGQFSADLLTFVNPQAWGRLLPPLPAHPRQFEGFAYLGLGVLGLLGLRLVSWARARPTRAELLEALPWLTVALAMAGYALSNHVTLAGKEVLDLSSFYARLGPVTGWFRSSGRFAWPLAAGLTLSAVWAVARLRTPWVRTMALGAAAVVQLADFDTLRIGVNHGPGPKGWELRDPAWQLLGEGYRHLHLYPVQLMWTCPFDTGVVAPLSWEAYRQRLTINSAFVGRAPAGVDCSRHYRPDELDAETVYVPTSQPYLEDLLRAGMTCGRLDGHAVCVAGQRETPLSQVLARRAKGEAR